MIIKTKDFAEVANKIKEAVSLAENAANLEVVAKGIGGLAYHWQTRRTADAKAYEIKKLSLNYLL